MRNDLSDKIGEGKYVLAEYDKIKRITIPLVWDVVKRYNLVPT